ncbi:MAG: hypothetical protein Kow0013_08740 [Pararhodobacter sp.]
MSDTTRDRDPSEAQTTPATDAGQEAAVDDRPTADSVTADTPTEDAPQGETAPRTEAQPAPETAPDAAAAGADPAPQARAAGAGSMIIGGVLSAAIGAGAALAILPEGWRRGDAGLETRITALERRPQGLDSAALAPLAARIEALENDGLRDRVAALEGRAPADLGPLEARLAALESQPAGASAAEIEAALAPTVATLTARLDQIEAAVAPLAERIARLEADIAAQARAAVDAALAETRAEIDAQAAALSHREESIEATQARIAARAALAELVAAAESGAAAPGALATIAEVTDLPAALAPLADGLTTLSALQDTFAPAARAALAAEPPAEDAGLGDRVLRFLRSQTGARSLAPREGNSTDAILSRAEAALRRGDLSGSLAELDDLTGAPAEAMTEWRAQAQTRLDALAALDALGTQLNRSED